MGVIVPITIRVEATQADTFIMARVKGFSYLSQKPHAYNAIACPKLYDVGVFAFPSESNQC